MGLRVEAAPHPVEERVEEHPAVEERAVEHLRAAPVRVTERLASGGDSRLPRAEEIEADTRLRSATTPSLRLRVDGTRLRDVADREVMLRGANAGGRSKWAPFFPFAFAESGRQEQAASAPFEKACADYLDGSHKLGHNFLRVPFTWEAVEPVRGQYDEKYLSRLERFVDLAAARGMRVMLDSHQDLFSNAYGGDGFPKWALSAPNATQPWYGRVLWGLGYEFDGNVRRDFRRFWENKDGLQDDYERMWKTVASRFASKSNVVGFEIINEPDAGAFAEKKWSRDRLTAFHSRLGSAIRAVAPDTPVVFGPSGRDGMRAHTDTEKPSGDGWVFAPHYYDAPRMTLSLLGASAVTPVLGKVDARTPLGRWRAQGDKWNVPVVVGEFGIPRAATGAPVQLEATYNALDAHRLSGAVWEYSTTSDDWNHEGMSLVAPGGVATSASRVSTRPYPAAIAGTLLEFAWSAKDQQGNVAFDARAGAVSEIALPAALVGDQKISVRVADDAKVRWKYENERLLIEADQPGHVVVYFELKPP